MGKGFWSCWLFIHSLGIMPTVGGLDIQLCSSSTFISPVSSSVNSNRISSGEHTSVLKFKINSWLDSATFCRKHAKIFKGHRVGGGHEKQSMLAAVASARERWLYGLRQGRDWGWALGLCGWWIKGELLPLSVFHMVHCPGMAKLRETCC